MILERRLTVSLDGNAFKHHLEFARFPDVRQVRIALNTTLCAVKEVVVVPHRDVGGVNNAVLKQ